MLRQELVALEAYMVDIARSLEAQGCTNDDIQLPADWSQQVMDASQPGTDAFRLPAADPPMQAGQAAYTHGMPEQAPEMQQIMQASQAQLDESQMPASLFQKPVQAPQAQLDEAQLPAELFQQADPASTRSTSPLASTSCTCDSQPLPASAPLQFSTGHEHALHGDTPHDAPRLAHSDADQTEALAADPCSVSDIDARMVALGWR